MEALAFGLSRALGHVGSYAEALDIVDRALTCRPYSIHLKAARHALASGSKESMCRRGWKNSLAEITVI